jgi:hypothetical protein
MYMKPAWDPKCAGCRQVTAGLAGKAPGVLLMWRGATADVSLSRTRDRMFPFIRKLTHDLTFKRHSAPVLHASLHAKGAVHVRDISTTLCAEAAWQFASAGASLWAAHAVPAGPGTPAAPEQSAREIGPSEMSSTSSTVGSPTDGGAKAGPVPPSILPALVQPLHWEADFEVRCFNVR